MRLRVMHEMGFVHNDLKLENMVVGHQDSNRLYLIDFGLTSRYRDEVTGELLPKINLSKFTGNFMFASMNQCRGNTTSRRDDIEAAIHILVYLISN